MAPLLELHRYTDLLVLDGRIGLPDPAAHRPEDVAVEWHRSGPRRVRFMDTLEERLLAAARLRLPRLRNWALAA